MNDHITGHSGPELNPENRFGSARFADDTEIRAAGMFRQGRDSLLIGFSGRRPLFYSGAGGLLLTAGARGGKLRDVLGYNVCAGIHAGPMVILDPKGELAAISQDQTRDRKHVITWNPSGLHGLPRHRINPVDYIRADSPTLVSDVKVFAENAIPLSGAPQAQYFERRAQEFLEAIALTLVMIRGVLTLPGIFGVLSLIPKGGEDWAKFAFEMKECGFPLAARVEAEIDDSRKNPSNGFQGILGELFKSFAALSDPILLESVSPPYDFSLADLTRQSPGAQLYLICPAEFIAPWASVIKSLFVAGMVHKARAPRAPRQTWILDEAAQLGRFPLLTQLYTYGAGIGLRPWAVFQSTDQLKATGPNAETIIPASAACQSYFAIRDIGSASAISKMLGAQTLSFDNELAQQRARHAKAQAVHALLEGGDPLSATLSVGHQNFAAAHQAKQMRWLRTPDEVLNTPASRQFIVADGLAHPIYADRRPYFDQPFMAGRFHPNPYHPPANKVRVNSMFGRRWRRVVQEPVPARFADYPQYSSGLWSKVR